MARNPIIVSTILAALAAVAFGVPTPFVQRLGIGVGPFATAALFSLQRVSATYSSLLLNGEAIFTVGLAAIIYREHVGKRVALAVTLMVAGGAVTVVSSSAIGTVGLWGALAIVAAVFAWALDNVLTRPFADLDPALVVRTKTLCVVFLTGALTLLLGEPRPGVPQVVGLIACGATG